MNANHGLSLLVMFCAFVAALFSAATAAPVGTGPSFKGPLGLQLYSFRDQFAKDVPGTLDKIRDLGFTDVELAGTYGLSAEDFKNDLDGVIREAKIFGVQWVGCAWVPHKDPFDEKTCREAIVVFNTAGDALAKEGIKFFSHTHGYEFQPYADGTLFDLMMAETRPDLVNFEMDIFWIVHAGQDPVKLFDKYGSRFQLTHLKGMKESTPTGLLTGHSDVTNDVPLGQGKIDLVPILKAAEKAGVKWNFIEDESPTSEQQIPQSLRYLEQVKW